MYQILLIISIFAHLIDGKNSKNISLRSQFQVPGDCIIKLPADIPKAEPLYINTFRSGKQLKYSLHVPSNNTLRVRTNSLITLSCTGKKNVIFNTKQNSTTLTCSSGTIFKDENNFSIDIRHLNCSKIPESELKITRSKCANNRGYIYNVGFSVFPHVFLTNFRICYDNRSENTFYAENNINGAAIKCK